MHLDAPLLLHTTFRYNALLGTGINVSYNNAYNLCCISIHFVNLSVIFEGLSFRVSVSFYISF